MRNSSDDVRGGTGLVDEFGFDLGAAKPDLVVRRGDLPGIESLDQEFGGVVIRDAERGGGRAGKEGHEADLDRRGFFCPRTAGSDQQQTSGENERPRIRTVAKMMAHGHSLPHVADDDVFLS